MRTIDRQASAVRDILSGIISCLLIITLMHTIPLLGIFVWVILPLPILFFRLKIGRIGSGMIMILSLFVLIILTHNIIFNVCYFGTMLITGFFLGEFIERHLPVEKIMLFTVALVGLSLFTMIFLYAMSQGKGIGQMVQGYFAQYQAMSEQFLSDSSQLYPQMNITPDDFKKAGDLLAMIFPGILINSYLTMVWINILLIKKLLKSRGILVKSIENLNLWKAPFYLVFGVIAFSVLTFSGSGQLKWIAINSLIILMSIYFFQGIAVVSYFFQKKSAPYALRFFIYLLIAIQPFFLTLVIGCGLFDTWANFRKIDITA